MLAPTSAVATYALRELDRNGRRVLALRVGDESWLLCGDPRRHRAVAVLPQQFDGGGMTLAEGPALTDAAPGTAAAIRFADGGLAGHWRFTPMPGDIWLLHPADAPAGSLAVSAGGVVLRGEGRRRQVLLVRPRGRRGWTLPKGTLEPGEAVRDGALREVREETGHDAAILGDLDPVEYRFPGSRDGERRMVHKVVHWFRMRPQGLPEPHSAVGEIEDVRWFDIDEAWAAIHVGALRSVVKQALRSEPLPDEV